MKPFLAWSWENENWNINIYVHLFYKLICHIKGIPTPNQEQETPAFPHHRHRIWGFSNLVGTNLDKCYDMYDNWEKTWWKGKVVAMHHICIKETIMWSLISGNCRINAVTVNIIITLQQHFKACEI